MNILPIEKQVCTRDQAERLAELLGDDAPESLWCWAKIDGCGTWEVVIAENFVTNPLMHWENDWLAAYTGDELVVLLPPTICECFGMPEALSSSKALDTLAQAKAALLIEILEQKIIKPNEINYE